MKYYNCHPSASFKCCLIVAQVIAILGASCTRALTPAEACVETAAAICDRQAACGQSPTTAEDCKEGMRQSCVSGLTCPPEGRFDASKVDGCIAQIRNATCDRMEDPLLLTSCAAVCTSVDGTPVGEGSNGGGAGGWGGSPTTTGPACDFVGEGMNFSFVVDGEGRQFILRLPTSATYDGPFPVIFNWHGLGGTAAQMDQLVAPYVNDPTFPSIVVTPEDTDYTSLGADLDWDIFKVNAVTNREARLFDEILLCLQKRYRIDSLHIHSLGYSMGAILTDMLGTIRGQQLASIATFSGGYFSNSVNVASLGSLASMVSWPSPTHSNSYAQVILHGGTSDVFTFDPITVHFDAFAASDTAYLNRLHHDVILCNHGGGHTAPVVGFDAGQVLEFFKTHPKGTFNSPYQTGLPADYPTYCTFSSKK
jgi:predicted esterase